MSYYSEFISILMDRADSKFTPDILKLRDKDHFVFVIDDFRQGGQFHSVIENCEYYGIFTTLFAEYDVMRVSQLDGKEAPVPCQIQQTRSVVGGSRLRGEVYRVTFLELLKMDLIFENTVSIKRKPTYIAGKNGSQNFSAWVYLWKGRPPEKIYYNHSEIVPAASLGLQQTHNTVRVAYNGKVNPPASKSYPSWDNLWENGTYKH